MKKLCPPQHFFWQAVLPAVCVAGFAAVSSVEASSITFEPDVFTVQAGQTVTLPVAVDPAGLPGYTVRLSVVFPPGLLEATGFAFSPGWMAVAQPGYDSLDNERGELIKTGGFPKGFSSPVPFGSITFRVKEPGEGAIVAGPQSFVLDAKNSSTLESRPQARVIAVAAGESVPEAASVEPLPALPLASGEKNIFDISLEPEQKTSRPSAAFFMLLFAAAAVLGIIGRIIVARFRRWSFMKKIKHDKDLKN